VINTCGFIAPAKQEAIEAIAEAVECKTSGSVKKVIVTGCLAQRMGQELLDEVDGIDAIIGLGERDNIAAIIKQTLHPTKKATPTIYMDAAAGISDDRGRMLITPGHWAYMRISEGCDRKCAFCTIPDIRGRFRSKPENIVISEAKELVGNGAVELSIIAQDSNYYGRDLGEKDGLARLITNLEKIDGLEWIRLMYLYPAGIDDRLIDTIAGSEKVLNYVDMPIQHINDDILKSMRRSDRKDKTIALVERLRAAMADVVLRTTVITGLPGETEESFAELLEFVKWARFDALGCFSFYPEAGTAAAEMGGQVPEDIRKQRADILMGVQQEIAFEKARQRVGKKLTCLIDEAADEDGVGIGRFFGQAPHVDSICLVKDCSAKPGDFVETEVLGVNDYDLIVEKISG
jgi:ribosomal protein S12 methylthiotransferase